MTESELTIAKFHACTGIEKSLIQKWLSTDDEESLCSKYDLNKFRRILIKYDMDEYTSLLINYLIFQLKIMALNEDFSKKNREFLAFIEEEEKYEKDLTEALIFFNSQKQEDITSLTLQSQTNKIIVRNKKIIDSIFKNLLEDFKNNEYNLDSLTEYEALEEIKQKKDKDWIRSWEKDQKNYDENGDLVIWSDSVDNIYTTEEPLATAKQDENFISNKMIKAYAKSHETPREINLEFLKKFEVNIYNEKKSPGAFNKNQQIRSVAKALSYLKRIDRLLDSKEDFTDIEEIPIDYQFIHDCLATFGFIDDYTIKKYITTTPKKYIRSIMNYNALKSCNPFIEFNPDVNEIMKLKSQTHTK